MTQKGLKPFFLLIAIGLIGTMGVKAGFKHDITIEEESQTVTMTTFSQTVGAALTHADIELREGDVVIPSEETRITGDLTIRVLRAKAVSLVEGEGTRTFFTTETQVGKILAAAGIELDDNDQVYPRKSEQIALDRKIEIVRVDVDYEEVSETLHHSTVYKLTEDLEPGKTQLLSEGEDGLSTCTFKNVYENGVLVSRQLDDQVVSREPIAEIVEEGLDKLLVTSRGMPFRYKEMIVMRATAYDLSYESCGKYPGDPAYGITYSGTKARPGVVAVDPRVIKLGSNLYVESLDSMRDYGFSSAEDTGSAIKGNRIDLFIENRSQALRYGTRYVRVYVLDEPIDENMMIGYAN
ncbi:DUF348 domain-containing protein [Fusibacter paucivorans]|uniref:DUF348 domain-containing protein n=1 Tax=Fusibacter paucivorans TaxID=76009 RepID=A0ABS5PQH3_9FIRM|nr:3D domain-containing protein [Fusibacter paucivorans]MBS7527172.1 DUF348 domain-containing protein [Fusibacter paucivorans]